MSKFFVLALVLAGFHVFAQDARKTKWVDSVFATLKKDEKAGQLFLVPFSSYASKEDKQELISQSKSGKIGGLLIDRSGPVGYAKMVNKLQASADVPMIIGTVTHHPFDSIENFFDDSVLNAVTNDSLLNQFHEEVSRQMDMLSIHFFSNGPVDAIGELRAMDVREIPTTAKSKKGDEEKLTFLLGGDFLIAPKNLDAGIKAILKVIKKDKILAGRLDTSVKRILALKYDAELARHKFITTDNLLLHLNTARSQWLRQKLAEAAITVAQNQGDIIPIQKLDAKGFASVSIGGEAKSVFTQYLSKYADCSHFSLVMPADTAQLAAALSGKVVVVALFSKSPSLLKEISPWINGLSRMHEVIVTGFTAPEDLAYFTKAQTIIAAYGDDPALQQSAAEIIFGGIPAQGKLTMRISDVALPGKSIRTKTTGRFTYERPEDAGMNSTTLAKIESIALEAISIGATPGCIVLVAKDGKVVYENSFGTLAYDKKVPVTDETVYDLASVTKVSATLQTVMYMQESGLIDVNKKVSAYLPELKGSNKEDMIIKDILTHQAGLWPYLPFWSETVKDSALFDVYYRHTASEAFPYPVSENLFASKSMKDSLWHWIIKAKIREKPAHAIYDYRYSDMGFYMMQHMAEKILRQPMEDFLQKNIYKPIGARSIGYLPLRKFLHQIAPTEHDTLFRKSLLTGYVHDQGAAMHGGVAGHAGLFSNANDLAKLGQLWLNGGSYGGVQVFKKETLDFFTAKQYEDSRRGLGWDKPVLNEWNSPTTWAASARTFGHTGFTGTCIWVDPEFNLVYVFLSNRVNPDMNNNKILNANIRPRIQEVIYQSIFDYCKNH